MNDTAMRGNAHQMEIDIPPIAKHITMAPHIMPTLPPATRHFSFMMMPCIATAMPTIRSPNTSIATQQSLPPASIIIKQIAVMRIAQLPTSDHRPEVMLSM